MKQNRSKTIAAALVLMLLLAGIIFSGQLPVSNVTQKITSFVSIDAFNIHQVITADSTTSRTIMWQSSTEEKDAFVEYRKVKTTGAMARAQKERINDKFTDDGKTTWVHTVTLKDLEPGTEYEYRLGHGDSRSPWFKLLRK